MAEWLTASVGNPRWLEMYFDALFMGMGAVAGYVLGRAR